MLVWKPFIAHVYQAYQMYVINVSARYCSPSPMVMRVMRVCVEFMLRARNDTAIKKLPNVHADREESFGLLGWDFGRFGNCRGVKT
jgi:hypothetical protein